MHFFPKKRAKILLHELSHWKKGGFSGLHQLLSRVGGDASLRAPASNLHASVSVFLVSSVTAASCAMHSQKTRKLGQYTRAATTHSVMAVYNARDAVRRSDEAPPLMVPHTTCKICPTDTQIEENHAILMYLRCDLHDFNPLESFLLYTDHGYRFRP